MLLLRSVMAVLCAAFLALSYSVPAQAADSPPIIEGFGCTFLEGQGFDDLDKAIDFYKAQLPKIESPELQKMGSVLWVPYRGTVNADFVWINTNMTLNEWGKLSVAYDSSKEGQAADEKFFDVAKCNSGLATNETLFQTDDQFTDEVLIQSFRCQLHPGKTVADTDAVIAAWKPVFAKAVKATNASSLVMRRLPLVSGSGYDLTYAVIWDDAAAYAEATSAFQADPDSAESDRLFTEAHRCDSAMFKARIVVPWED